MAARKTETASKEAAAVDTAETKTSETAENTEGGGQEQEDQEQEGQDPEGDSEEPKEEPKVLTALRPILYLAKQYKAGDALPPGDPEMVAAWLEAGSAEWRAAGPGARFPKGNP